MSLVRNARRWVCVVVVASAQACGDRTVAAPFTPGAVLLLQESSASLYPLEVFGIAPPAGQPCSAPAYREFDFWVGNWDVYQGSTQTLAGVNEVKSKLGGCVVEENWQGAGGFRGRSLNAYDHASGTWSQMWVDQGGCPNGPIFIEGGFAGGSMTMTGTRSQPAGVVLGPPCAPPPAVTVFSRTNRIRWTPLPSGSVLQQLQAVNDGAPLPPLPPASDLIGLRYDPVDMVMPLPPPGGGSFCPFRVAAQQFDFMLGTWRVHQGNGGGSQGTVTFSEDLNGCLIEEHVAALGGYEGISFNTFDAFTGQWVRTYVDNQGQRLFLRGGLVGSGMVLAGTTRGQSGQEVGVRVTWLPLTADEVEQTWEFSRDGGATWVAARVLRYTRES